MLASECAVGVCAAPLGRMFRLSLRSRSSLLHRLGFCGLRRASENVPLRRCIVEKVDQCVVVRLVSENKENRVNPEFLDAFHKALDQVER